MVFSAAQSQLLNLTVEKDKRVVVEGTGTIEKLTLQQGSVVYLAVGSDITLKNLTLDKEQRLVNLGQVRMEGLNVSSGGVFINQGTATISGSVNINGTESRLDNRGTLTVQNGLTSTGQIENSGLIEVKNNQVSLTGGSYVARMQSKLLINGNLTLDNVSLQGPLQEGIVGYIELVGSNRTVTANGGANSNLTGYINLIGAKIASGNTTPFEKLNTPNTERVLGNEQLRAELLSYASYYPFGAQMPTLEWHKVGYRWGFNEKEKDIDFQNNYDYGARIYNATIGRFLSEDPLKDDFPWLSTYAFAANKPITFIDLDGLEPVWGKLRFDATKTHAIEGFYDRNQNGRVDPTDGGNGQLLYDANSGWWVSRYEVGNGEFVYLQHDPKTGEANEFWDTEAAKKGRWEAIVGVHTIIAYVNVTLVDILSPSAVGYLLGKVGTALMRANQARRAATLVKTAQAGSAGSKLIKSGEIAKDLLKGYMLKGKYAMDKLKTMTLDISMLYFKKGAAAKTGDIARMTLKEQITVLENFAKSQGAESIRINGLLLQNDSLKNPEFVKRAASMLGYAVEAASDGAFTLVKKL